MIKPSDVASYRDSTKSPTAKSVLNALIVSGLSDQESLVYMIINNDGPLSVNAICERIERPQNHVGNIISKFLRLGLIARENKDWKYIYRTVDFSRSR